MNLANKLTLTRIILIPIIIILLAQEDIYARFATLVIFIIAAITDLYDGMLARREKKVTNWGKLMDPLADKLLTSAIFISFVGMPQLHIPAWMVFLIITREFLITGLRMLAISEGTVIAASGGGKIKTTSQMVAIIAILLILLVRSYCQQASCDLAPAIMLAKDGWYWYLAWTLELGPHLLMLITTLLTVLSGVSYLLKYKKLIWP
ncbi:MAG: CDP-diacylglycerol--glycerol-3-phosphate 3-phosphatidyltransferase [bacterium]|nr:CDP-diacylglycerol--glycerol-3-phosphate 3-phosphatidyltransferase [bacterium]